MLRHIIFLLLNVQSRLNDLYRKHYGVTSDYISECKTINKQVSVYISASSTFLSFKIVLNL